MDTITFSGQLLVATQNDTCRAISVTINNTGESCCNGCDVAIAGIICGAVVLICLMAMIILRCKLKNDNEWEMIQAVIEKKKREQEHAWDVKKEMVDREKLLQDREFNKKHEYQKNMLEYIKEEGVSNENLYIINAKSFLQELKDNKRTQGEQKGIPSVEAGGTTPEPQNEDTASSETPA